MGPFKATHILAANVGEEGLLLWSHSMRVLTSNLYHVPIQSALSD